MRPIPQLRSAGVALAVALASLTSCTDRSSTGPQSPTMSLSAGPQARPFYYYHGSPVYLDVDSSGFVISSTVGDPTAVVSRSISALGAVRSTRLTQLPDHWIVRPQVRLSSGTYQTALAQLRAIPQLSFVSSLYRSAEGGGPQVPVGHVVVRFKGSASGSSIDSLVASLGASTIRRPSPDSGRFYYVLAYPRDRDPLEFAAALYHHPLVEWADPDMIADIAKYSAEPYFPYQYYLTNPFVKNGVHVDINVAPAWNVTTGTNAVTLIVVDDGMEGAHTDLWCDPWYFWVHDGFLNQYPDTPTYPHPWDRHGTAVAGILHGCHNSSGIAGIAPGVVPGILRIFRADMQATWEQIADGINWAWAVAGADVISNSWGCRDPIYPTSCHHDPVDYAIHYAATLGRGGKGTVVVFAAGNTSNREATPPRVGGVSWPGVLSDVIAVGAIDRFGNLTNYTPEGPELDIVGVSSHYTDSSCVTPGDLVTTDRFGSVGCNDGPLGDPNYTSSFGGTSAAAPQVAGAAALILSVNPTLTRQAVTALLLNHADNWGPGNKYGAGKLNVWASVAPLVPPPPPPFSATISGPNPVQPYSYCLFTAIPANGSAPFSYAWTADGLPVGDDSEFYHHSALASAYQLGITVTDGQGRVAINYLAVSVDPGAPQCNDQ